MSRAFFISLLLHSLAVALVFSFFKYNSFSTDSNIKKISLNSIKIEKHKAKRQLRAKSQELRAKSEKKAESLKQKEKIEDIKTKEEQTLQTKKEPKVEAKREQPQEKKATSYKLQAKSLIEAKKKQKTKTKKPKLKKRENSSSQKRKIKSHKRAKSQNVKAKSRKKSKRAKHKAKSKKLKAKNSKHKIRRKSSKAKSSKYRSLLKKQTPVTNKQSLTTNNPNIKAQIYQAINEAKVYPRLAKKMNLQGSVYTCFNISPSGSVSNISTSGAHTLLQRGARETINRAKYSFPNIPNPMHICLTITFTLE